MNKIQIIGRSGHDAEIKYLPSGKAVLNVNVADTKKIGNESRTQWIRVSIFGERAVSLAPFIKKGTEIVAFGELELREYEEKGVKKYFSQINASYMRACVSTYSVDQEPYL